MADANEPLVSKSKPLVERAGLWIGTLGSLITIVLTLVNAQTKNEIDKREENLKALEVQLKERTTGIEESKERVERYKWVLSLLPSLMEEDTSKRNFTVALVRLALTKDEAEQLFSGLQASASKELRQAGQQGFESIENQELNRLVLQMNANSSEDRRSAVAKLEREYSSSAAAISLVLDLYNPERISALSPSGVINGFYYLSATDPQAWTSQNAQAAREAMSRISAKSNIGPQTRAAIAKLEQHLTLLAVQ